MKNIFKKLVTWLITLEARLVLRKYKPRIVAITGNVGKTSAKDAIYSAFKKSYFVQKSEKSLNSEIGVPLAILGCESGWNNPLKWMRNIFRGFLIIILPTHYPRLLILEVGADHPGDIKSITKWLKPDIAVITGIPDTPVHVEFFDSPEEIVEEKLALVEALKPDGTLVLNGDDDRALSMKANFRGVSVTYGFNKGNDFIASSEEVIYENSVPVGVRFRIDQGATSVPITIPCGVGRAHVYSALASVVVGNSVGLDMVQVGVALSRHIPPQGRMRLLSGLRDTTIIDDSYNASPAAMLSALNTLETLMVPGRKIVMLGDMLELGRYSTDAHKRVGKRVAEVADLFITVGIRARASAEEAMSSGMVAKKVRQYDSKEAARAAEELETELRAGDIILIKGSQSMRMERATKAIMAEPIRARELLVRQEPEWLSRA